MENGNCRARGVHKLYGNIWVRHIIFNKKGEIKKGHKHKFDHIHFLSAGSAAITQWSDDKDPVTVEYKAPAWIQVPKEVYHDIVALEDNTAGHCIQAMRDEDGEVMETDFTTSVSTVDRELVLKQM